MGIKKCKAIILLIIFSLMIAFIMPNFTIAKAETSKPARVINLVYDDSSSMIEDGVSYHDRWCQAKYALEVFAAMLEENDTMNVYTMSDFSYTDFDYSSVPPNITLFGKSSVSDNVSQIHNMVTDSYATPFQAVEKAYSDLSQAEADEKWLVVLTDGEFSRDFSYSMPTSEIDSYFANKDADISVMYLTIGSDAQNITQNESNNIYTESAVSSTDILSKITEISNRIFDRNRLTVDPASGSFSFDIPMSELIVFAQGKEVKINGIKTKDGSVIKADDSPVEVKYSETAALNYAGNSNVVVNKNLVGKIAYFNGDFDSGDYAVDAPGADTIEVYYKPNVDIAVYLVNSEGTRLSASDPIPQGQYTLECGFVKSGTDVILPDSELLGNIEFSAEVSCNGEPDGKVYANGDTVDIKEGSLDINASAEYLDYNELSVSLHYDVFQDKSMSSVIENETVYVLQKDGFENPDDPIILNILVDGRELTEEEWDSLEDPTLDFVSGSSKLGSLKLVKTDTVGMYEIYPSVYEEDGKPLPKENDVGDFTFLVSFNQKIGNSVWSGQIESVLHIKDGMTFIERYPWVPYLLISIAAVILLFVWWITRKVLPKDIRIQQGTTVFIVAPSPFPQEGIEAKRNYKRKGKKLEIMSPPSEQNYEAQCTVTLMLKPVDRRYVKSKKRRIAISELRSGGSVYSITINGMQYAKNSNGKWVEEAYLDTEMKKETEQIVKNAIFEMKTGSPTDTISRCECQLKHI